MSYIILEYFTSCSEENIFTSGGWFETDYQKLIEDSKEGYVRHSSNRLSRAIYYWFRKKNKNNKK